MVCIREEWRFIPDFDYLVSDQGRVWSTKKNRILKPCLNADGYPQVTLRRDGKGCPRTVHSLVEDTSRNPLWESCAR